MKLDQALESDKNSAHRAEVVEVNFRKLEGSDHLSITEVCGGYSYLGRTADWAGVKKGVFIPPDSLVNVSRPEFQFLADRANADGYARIKARRMCGAMSFGLMVPVPDDAAVGEDWADRLGILHYNPPEPGRPKEKSGGPMVGQEDTGGPSVFVVKYDLESGRRYGQRMFQVNEPVVVLEKIHGASSRMVFSGGRLHVGSRTNWKLEYPDYSNVTVEMFEPKVGRERAEEIVARIREKAARAQKNSWWQALDNTPALRTFLEANPDLVVYGEVYGAVQNLRYGVPPGEVRFAAFDIMKDGRWLDFEEAHGMATAAGVPWVPILGRMPFDFDRACEFAEGKTTMPGADHVREGCVVRPLVERRDPRLGRACLKWVGCGYLEKS